MGLKSKGMLALAKHRPQFMLIPLVPIALAISSFVLSVLAFRKARRLSLRTVG